MRRWLSIAWLSGAIALTVPAFISRLTGVHATALIEALVFGAGILGAAFLLSWAAEVAQLEISQALALAPPRPPSSWGGSRDATASAVGEVSVPGPKARVDTASKKL